MHCQNCHQEVPDIAKVCGHCGTKLDRNVMFPCPSCAEDVPVTAKVCGYCGKKLVQLMPEPAESKPAHEPEKPPVVETPVAPYTEPKPAKAAIKKQKPKKPIRTKQKSFKIPLWGWIAAAVAAAVLVIVFVIPSSRDTSMVYFACDRETIPAGNEVFVYYYWSAKTPAQVNKYFDVAEHFVSVNGVWYKIRNAGLDEIRYDDDSGLYKRRYWMNIGTLKEPGWYRINTIVDINGYVYDGFGFSGPGTDNPRIDVDCDVQVVN